MQAFPNAARALRDVGVIGALAMHLEVLVRAVAEQLRAARSEVGEPATNCPGVALVVSWRWIVDMAVLLDVVSLLAAHSLLD